MTSEDVLFWSWDVIFCELLSGLMWIIIVKRYWCDGSNRVEPLLHWHTGLDSWLGREVPCNVDVVLRLCNAVRTTGTCRVSSRGKHLECCCSTAHVCQGLTQNVDTISVFSALSSLHLRPNYWGSVLYFLINYCIFVDFCQITLMPYKSVHLIGTRHVCIRLSRCCWENDKKYRLHWFSAWLFTRCHHS